MAVIEVIQDGEAADEQEQAQEAPQDAGSDAETTEASAESSEQTEEPGLVVTIGEEAPPSDEDQHSAPEWVRELRKTNREQARRIRELEQRQPAEPATVKVGDKPTLEGCDFDAERFESELEAWTVRKRAAEDKAAETRKAQEQAEAAWQARLATYRTAAAELKAKAKDFDEAEESVKSIFSVVQQGVMLNGADKPELLVYALGKNPKKAAELASISDPVKFAFAVAKLETQLKVQPRKAAPLPERAVRGSAPALSADSTLEKLREQAAQTGDYTKVAAYRKQMRAKT